MDLSSATTTGLTDFASLCADGLSWDDYSIDLFPTQHRAPELTSFGSADVVGELPPHQQWDDIDLHALFAAHPCTTNDNESNRRSPTPSVLRIGTGFSGGSCIDLDAKVKTRTYNFESSTSKREITAQQKRRLDRRAKQLSPSEAELLRERMASKADEQRLKNTIAARKTRKRKKEFVDDLVEQVKRLEADNQALKDQIAAMTRQGGVGQWPALEGEMIMSVDADQDVAPNYQKRAFDKVAEVGRNPAPSRWQKG